jgi:hypothetical protein
MTIPMRKARCVNYRRVFWIRLIRLDLMLGITWIPWLLLWSPLIAAAPFATTLESINSLFYVFCPFVVGCLFLAWFTKVLVKHR